MEDDLIVKIRVTLHKGYTLNENDVRALMILIRKLLENMSNENRNKYLVLLLFCNWAVHNQITSSNTGLRILAKVNDAIVSIKDSKNTEEIRDVVSHSFWIPELRRELKLFLSNHAINDAIVSDDRMWAFYLEQLIEIIRDVELRFPIKSDLDRTKTKIYEKIVMNSIKVWAGVISLKVSLFEYPQGGSLMSLIVETEDSTKIIIPLLIDVSI